MDFRGLVFVFLVSVSSVAAAEPVLSLYQRGENFAERPRNWVQSQTNQFYGFDQTRITGGRGAAGGFLQPRTFFNCYADIYLNGALQRGAVFSGSGRLVLARTSGLPPFTAAAYVGHFGRTTEPFINTVGLAVYGAGAGNLFVGPVVQFADGTAFTGVPASVLVSAFRFVTWTYEWNPSGGLDGAGRLTAVIGNVTTFVDVPASTRDKTFTLDAFGIYQPRFTSPEADSFVELYVGQLGYTAGVGNPPKVNIRRIRRSSPESADITLEGTARVLRGNRIKAVRYRIVRDGKTRQTRAADGTTDWTARVRIPQGQSRIEIIARSDSGLTTTTERRVRRTR